MEPQHDCPRCGRPITIDRMTICTACADEFTRRLEWLDKIGMPTLQQVAYRKASFGQKTIRSGNKAFAPTPLNETAQHIYNSTEAVIQQAGALIDLRPIGWDRDDRPRTLRDWVYLCPQLVQHMPAISRKPEAAGMLDRLAQACEQVRGQITRPGERRLIGVCTECLKCQVTVTDEETGETSREPLRTPIYAASTDTHAVCPYCGAFLNLSDVRIAYLKAAGLLHITKTQADAARWVRDSTGVPVTGKDLRNWRTRGKMPGTRHIEGPYWAWNIIELLACAEEKRRNGRNRL